MKYLEIETEKLPVLIDEMNTLLSNYQIYYQKLRNFHWNIRGENFFELHEFFENLYKDAHQKIDAIAERIQTLKYRPLSLMKKYLEVAEVKEIDAFLNDKQMMKSAISDQYTLIKNMRRVMQKADAAQDYATIQLMQSFLIDMEKFSWMMDSWMKKPVRTETKEPVLTQ